MALAGNHLRDFGPAECSHSNRLYASLLLEHKRSVIFQHDMKMVRRQGVPEPVHILFLQNCIMPDVRRDGSLLKFGTDRHHTSA